MKISELYSKPIYRYVNPSISATNNDPATEKIEIEEYVFTDEVFNGLYSILDAIKNNKNRDHVGIWIDGYYGSGKSHFLKYLDYCFTTRTREYALERLLNAVKEIDPLDLSHNLIFDYNQILEISKWLKKATIQTSIFNLETSYNESVDKKKSFLNVFWNEFNEKRGFNKFNTSLAQHLEKPLFEKGVFEEFKQRILEETDVDWNDAGMAADIIDNELDIVLNIAKDLAPTLDKESIRQRIINRDTNMSIDRFALELKSFLKDKGDDYRLIFLADEVSQFINKERDRYLNLQEIVTKLSEACENKVWIVCTAQQDLSEILDDCHIAEERDKEGKIKGRFEIKVSLKGAQSEMITQKRILDKKDSVKSVLGNLYEEYKDAFNLQFNLPISYDSYERVEDFINYYPFVPYQFKLIVQVFDSFLNLGYVAKEVKGNERSVIKVIHDTGKATAEAEVGKFVSFDELYNNMFEQGLQNRGQKAISNAMDIARKYEDSAFAIRVVNVLFMICNISRTDKLTFPATIENLTSLLVNDMTTPRLDIKKKLECVVEFLCNNNIIRLEHGKEGLPDTYVFYGEEEMKVARLIKSQVPDNDKQANVLKDIFVKYLGIKTKMRYVSRAFSLCVVTKQRNIINNNNAEFFVDFNMDTDYESPEKYAFDNQSNRLTYFMGHLYHNNKRLYNDFFWYCQVNSYMMTPVMSDENEKIRKEFERRATDLYTSSIIPAFHNILDTCPIISGHIVISSNLGNNRGEVRFQLAIEKHLSSLYTRANLVSSDGIPKTTEELKTAILRKDEGELDNIDSLSPPEIEIENFLNTQTGDVNIADVLARFTKTPYGWDDICTLYVVNELVRHGKREYLYCNSPIEDIKIVANNISTEKNKFTLRKVIAIPIEIIKNFTNAWKEVFGGVNTFGTSDSNNIFRACIREDSPLKKLYTEYSEEILPNIKNYAFSSPIKDIVNLFKSWMGEREPLNFFRSIIEKRDEARGLIDKCKEVKQFVDDQLSRYEMIIKFVNENELNFNYIDSDFSSDIEELKKIKEDEWPIGSIRRYKNLLDKLKNALENVRLDLCKKIKVAYENTCDDIINVAKEQVIEVPFSILVSREKIIEEKTQSSDIQILKSNVSTDEFYKQEINKIMDYVTSHSSSSEANKPKIGQVALNTKTKTPIATKEDVDNYLEDLRKQLLKLLDSNDSIMIIK